MGKTLLWVFGVLLVLVLAALKYSSLTRDSTNARVAEEVRQNPAGDRAARTMLLTLEDGTMLLVNFLHEGHEVFTGIDGLWSREFVGEGQKVSMFSEGETLTVHAVTVLDRPDYQKDIFSQLRSKVPKWLPDALNGNLVVITLDAESAT
jgi:hypothetical protein